MTELVDRAVAPCEHAEHRATEDAAVAILKGLYVTDVLPETVRNVVLRFYVFDALHNIESSNPLAAMMGQKDGDMRKAMAKLGDGERFVFVMNVATAVCRALNVPLDAPTKSAVDGIPLVTGQYA
jgi:hypothetical protein